MRQPTKIEHTKRPPASHAIARGFVLTTRAASTEKVSSLPSDVFLFSRLCVLAALPLTLQLCSIFPSNAVGLLTVGLSLTAAASTFASPHLIPTLVGSTKTY